MRIEDRESQFKRIIAAKGTPICSSQRLPVEILGRYLNGETVEGLAKDYGIPQEQVEWGIRIAYLLEQRRGTSP